MDVWRLSLLLLWITFSTVFLHSFDSRIKWVFKNLDGINWIFSNELGQSFIKMSDLVNTYIESLRFANYFSDSLLDLRKIHKGVRYVSHFVFESILW
jgi:hypothetical protein